jgi:hypothetical protein
MKQRVKTYGVKKNFNTMKFRSTKQSEYKIWLRWSKVKNIAGFKNVKGYQLYRNKGSGKWKMIRQFDYKARSWKDAVLDPGVKYTYKLVAFVVVDGEIIPVAESKIIYVFTKEGKKPKSNVKYVKINKVGNTDTSEIRHTIKKTIKKKKTAKISAVEKPTTSNPIKKVRKLRYESTNTKIATVTQKGVIKGKKKGTCWIRVYSQTGIYRSVKVRVK